MFNPCPDSPVNGCCVVVAAEKSRPEPAGGGQAQHPPAQGAGGEDATSERQGGVLAAPRRRGALARGDEIHVRARLITGGEGDIFSIADSCVCCTIGMLV